MHWVFESGSSHRNATITVDGARHTENKIFTRSSTVFHSGTANWTRRPDTYWKRNKFRVVFCLFIARVMRLRRFRGCCDGSGWVGVEGAVQKKKYFTLFGYSRESEAPVGVELPESDVAWHQNCRRGAGLRTTTEFLGRCDKQGQLFIVQATFLTVLLLVCRNIFTTLVENLMGLRIENAFVWPMTHHKSLIKLCIYTE
jgi:hypothetical protein